MTGERPIAIDCEGAALLGIVSEPAAPAEVGVIVVVGGPQYRAGSHRQFVQLARALADAGHAVLRFDARGMGDSDGAPRAFDALRADIGAAIDALLEHVSAVRRVALWGLCDGASAALLYVDERADPRVCGVCAVNPWVRSDEGLARAQLRHYYVRHLASPAFWRKLLHGGIGWRALQDLRRNIATALHTRAATESPGHDRPFAERMARGAARLAPGRLLVLVSEDDLTAREFTDLASRSPDWQRALKPARRRPIAGADHTFSQRESRKAAEAATLAWLRELGPAPAQRRQPAVREAT